MKKSIQLPLLLGIPLGIMVAMVLLVQSTLFKDNPAALSFAVTVDLLLTVPLIYFLLIRKTTLPKTSVLPFLIVGLVLCSFLLPDENQYYLKLFKSWCLPFIELSVFSYVIIYLRKGMKQAAKDHKGSFDFFSVLKTTCTELLPKRALVPVVTEIAVFYYGFIAWKKRILKANEFSYHKNSGTVSLLIAVIIIVGIETVSLHVLLLKWSETAAWIATALSIYSGVQLFGFLKSMGKRPISVENGQLYLRYGIMTETTIDLTNIDRIELSTKEVILDQDTRKLSFVGELESHNVVMHLNQKNTLHGLYGIKKDFQSLVFYVDDPNALKHYIER
jgi:hypothetical protein